MISFDFMGTSSEDSTDDIGSVQAPSAWKPLFEDDSTIRLFFNIYANSPTPLSTQVIPVCIASDHQKAMQCLVQIASIRSLFNTEPERDKFLLYLVEVTRDILQTKGTGTLLSFADLIQDFLTSQTTTNSADS
jgi:exportin-7